MLKFIFDPLRPETMSEDCLVLNVWTPSLGPSKKPVMVWLRTEGVRHRHQRQTGI